MAAGLPQWLLGVSLLGVLLAGALWYAARHRASPPSAPAGCHVSHDPRLTALLTTALSEYAENRAAQGLPLPDLSSVLVGHDRVLLRPDGEEPHVVVPAAGSRSPVAPVPYPALVTLGWYEGWTVLLDLEQAPGLISVAGDVRQAQRVLNGIVYELATSPWSAGVRLVLVGFGHEILVPSPDRIRHSTSLPDALAAVEQRARRSSIGLAHAGAANLATGRYADPGADRGTTVLVLAEPPAEAEIDRVSRLAGDALSGIVVVCLGTSSFARWRFEAGTGELAVPPLGLVLRPIVAAVEDRQRRLVTAPPASQPPPPAAVPPPPAKPAPPAAPPPARSPAPPVIAPPAPGPAPVEQPPGAAPGEQPPGGLPSAARPLSSRTAAVAVATCAVPRPVRPEEPGADGPARGQASPPTKAAGDRRRSAPVVVRVLGPVEVTAPGPVAAGQRALLTRLVVAATLRPGGVRLPEYESPSVLRGLHAWLGADDAGEPRLREHDGGWTLDVPVDWKVFRQYVTGAAPGDERALLTSALSLVRGEFGGDGVLAESLGEAMPQVFLGLPALADAAARRLAHLAAAAGDPGTAEWALRQGHLLVPGGVRHG